MSKTKAIVPSVTVVITMIAAVGFAIPSQAQTTKVNINLGERFINAGTPFRLQDRLEAVRYMLRGALGRVCHRFPDGFVVGYCVINGNTNTNQNSNTNTNSNANTNQNTNTNTNVNTNANSNQNTNTAINGNTNSGGGDPTPRGAVVLSEVFQSSTNNMEWIEIYNGMNVSVDFSGWFLSDNATSSPDTIPTTTPVIPGGLLIITATSSPSYLEPLPAGATKVFLGNATIGSGLATGGDEVHLYTPASVEVDAMSYGSDKNVFNPSVPVASPSTHSYYRTSFATDTNTSADWNHHVPNPGVGM